MMEMELFFELIDLIVAVAALVALLFTFCLTGKFIYHIYKVVNNCTGRYAFLFGALLWFMPSQLNTEGNEHHVQLMGLLPKLSAAVVITIVLHYLTLVLGGRSLRNLGNEALASEG